MNEARRYTEGYAEGHHAACRGIVYSGSCDMRKDAFARGWLDGYRAALRGE